MDVSEPVIVISAAVQAVATAVLVIVTIKYVALTGHISTASEAAAEAAQRSVKEMETQRIEGAQPLVVAALSWHTEGDLKNSKTLVIPTQLTNVGNGPALHIDAHLELEGTAFECSVSLLAHAGPGMRVPEAGPFAFHHSYQAWSPPARGRLVVTYEDIYERHHTVTTTFTLELEAMQRVKVRAEPPRVQVADPRSAQPAPQIAAAPPTHRPWWAFWRR